MSDKKIKFTVELPSGKTKEVSGEKNLRKELNEHFDEIYHKDMKWLHCRGMGTCGTCAMKINGSTTPPTAIEKWRLNFPPHKNSLKKGLRLLCQCKALSNLKLEKLEGRWGQGIEGNDV